MFDMSRGGFHACLSGLDLVDLGLRIKQASDFPFEQSDGAGMAGRVE